jgi:hypothetical protein
MQTINIMTEAKRDAIALTRYVFVAVMLAALVLSLMINVFFV